MAGSKLHQCAEGLVITAVGIVFTALSAGIRNNPVAVEGTIAPFVQAKFVPLVLSVLIMLQGLGLTVSQWKGNEKTVRDNGFSPRALTVVLITMTYLLLVRFFGFAVPTVIYIAALLFVVNKGRKPLFLLMLTVLYSIVALLVIPGLLNLPLL